MWRPWDTEGEEEQQWDKSTSDGIPVLASDSFQRSKSQTFDVPDRYSNQLKLHRQWEEEMERLNKKYRLNCFLDSELDSESDEGEEYNY